MTQRVETPDGDWEYRERPVTIVTFKHSETGEEIGPIYLPYDGEPPSEEGAYAQAWEFYTRVEHIRDNLTEEEIETLARDLRTGEYGKWLARELRALLATVKAAAKPGDDATPEEITETEETAAAINAIMRERSGDIASAFLEVSPRWHEFARDALSQAWAQAIGDLLAEHPDALSWPDDRFHPALRARYSEGGYLYGATLTAGPHWVAVIAQDIATSLEEEGGKFGPVANLIEEKARERVRKRRGPRPHLSTPALSFDADGRGFLPSNGIYRGVSQALGRFSEWQHKSGPYPEYRLPGKYGVAGHMNIAGDNALRIWDGIKAKAKQAKQHGDILPDVYIVIVATIHEHRDHLDLFGNGHPYIAIEAAMNHLGIRKSNRKYNLEDIEKVCSAIQAIGDIRVRGQRTAYIEGTGRVPVPFEGPIWQIMETIPKTRTQRELETFLSGERGNFTDDHGNVPAQSIAGWTLALGAGLLAGDDELPQQARVMRALMNYSPVHGRYKRRLGYSLSCEFRLRYKEQNWKQPYTVRDVFEDASLAVNTNDPRRAYKLFHEALEQLQQDGIIGEVRYVRPPRARRPFDPGYNTGKKGWLEPWLDTHIIIRPPADVEAAYREGLAESTQSRRRKRKPALKSAG
jgi:hypothetical protein